MNERIEHCLYEAGLTASGCWDELGTYEQEAIEKFAQLIIRECSGIAYEYDIPNLTGPGEFIGNRIKKHFGVEE